MNWRLGLISTTIRRAHSFASVFRLRVCGTVAIHVRATSLPGRPTHSNTVGSQLDDVRWRPGEWKLAEHRTRVGMRRPQRCAVDCRWNRSRRSDPPSLNAPAETVVSRFLATQCPESVPRGETGGKKTDPREPVIPVDTNGPGSAFEFRPPHSAYRTRQGVIARLR